MINLDIVPGLAGQYVPFANQVLLPSGAPEEEASAQDRVWWSLSSRRHSAGDALRAHQPHFNLAGCYQALTAVKVKSHV